MIKSLLIILLALCPVLHATSQGYEKSQRMQWFKDAKLGIFIHWGIYSVNGIDESWSFFNEYLSHEDYMKQLEGFKAENYDPGKWAEIFKESGARYAVMTSKHHDGVALWDTRMGDLDVVDRTPAGRDLVGPFCKALKKERLRVGLYYSLLDWSHPDYPNFTTSQKRYTEDSVRWERFTTFNTGQIKEISEEFDPDLVWFDGDWEQSAEKWHAREIREMLMKNNPDVIINSRLAGYGDYATPEQGIPVSKPMDEYWELCMTMNNSWGYQPNDKNYKPVNLVIRIFADVIGMGGNLLLDIGPKPDGTIAEEQVAMLQELGRWTHKHAEAIYGTHAGLPKDCFYGPSTLSPDSNIIYLFIPGNGIAGQADNGYFLSPVPTSDVPDITVLKSYRPMVFLKGVTNNISTIWVVGNGTKLSYQTWLKPWWSGNPGLVSIELPEGVADEQMTVVAVQLDGKIMLKF